MQKPKLAFRRDRSNRELLIDRELENTITFIKPVTSLKLKPSQPVKVPSPKRVSPTKAKASMISNKGKVKATKSIDPKDKVPKVDQIRLDSIDLSSDGSDKRRESIYGDLKT
jgi:hypothetical protein